MLGAAPDRPKISNLRMLFQAESKPFAGFSFFTDRQIFRCRQKTVGSRPISRVLSWTTIHLGSASPQTSSNLPGNPRGPRVAKCLFPYLVLLQVGFTVPRNVATRAVRSYRTVSPLPAPKRLGGLLSVALSVGSRPPGVTWHLALWSPDFPLHDSTAIAWPTPRIKGKASQLFSQASIVSRRALWPAHIPLDVANHLAGWRSSQPWPVAIRSATR